MNCLIPNVNNEQETKSRIISVLPEWNGMAKQGNENVKLSDFLVKIAEGQKFRKSKVCKPFTFDH